MKWAHQIQYSWYLLLRKVRVCRNKVGSIVSRMGRDGLQLRILLTQVPASGYQRTRLVIVVVRRLAQQAVDPYGSRRMDKLSVAHVKPYVRNPGIRRFTLPRGKEQQIRRLQMSEHLGRVQVAVGQDIQFQTGQHLLG